MWRCDDVYDGLMGTLISDDVAIGDDGHMG